MSLVYIILLRGKIGPGLSEAEPLHISWCNVKAGDNYSFTDAK